MAHGFTQNGDCWGPYAEDLARDHELVLVDCPGHGASGHDEADLWRAAQLLVEVGGPATYVGYSMGGRIALHAALASPEVVTRLVLIGATAGIDDETERTDRRQRDRELAEQLGRVGIEKFLDGWLTSPLFSGLSAETACRAQRLQNRPDGLVASLLNCGTGTQGSLWSRLPELNMPLLVVAGSDDSKFTAIGERIADEATNASTKLAVVNGTHAVHLERPHEVADVVRSFVAVRP